jgi:Flp pilus assembly protein TadB
MKKIIILAVAIFMCISLTYAQENGQEKSVNTIENQFNDVVDGSNDFQEYKVIKKVQINKLRANILDSISRLERNISGLNIEIDTQKNEIVSLSQTLSKTNEDLTLSRKKENGIEIFGLLTQKATYTLIMWSIIGILVVALAFFLYKFKNSHSVTREIRLKLAETETEMEKVRQTRIEEQQHLRRKLQDEINKNRKLQG